jgi:hypothetical protein
MPLTPNQSVRLATFDRMFEGIRGRKAFSAICVNAEHVWGTAIAVRVLRRNLVKYIKEFKATLRNLSV